MKPRRTVKRALGEELFLDSQSITYLKGGKAGNIADRHERIRGPRRTHPLRDWLTDWQENNES